MSIAEKITTIAENQQRVYDKGYTDGSNSVSTDYLSFSSVARFGNLNLFGKSEVVVNMPNAKNLNDMFRRDKNLGDDSANRTVKHITINTYEAKPTNMTMMFYYSDAWDNNGALEHITLNVDTSNVLYFGDLVAGNTNLTIIDGIPIDLSSITSSTTKIGYSTAKLAHIRFVPNTIKGNIDFAGGSAYTYESMKSIIDGLATVETAKTLSLHASQKILQSQVDSANAKGWTIAGGTVVSEVW